MKQIYLLPFVLLFCLKSYSQSVFAPLNQDYSHFIDRQEIISGKVSNEVHTSFKPFLRQSVYKMTEQIEKDSSVNLSKRDKFNMKYLKDDNWEWADSADTSGKSKKALLKVFYQKKNAFLQYRHPYFEVQANPIFYEMGGKERDGTQTNFMNSRGLELRGMIDKKIGFYTAMTTTQAIFPSYVNERIFNGRQSYIPGEGYFKPYKINGVDYYSARGYITFKATKHIQLQLGHDRNFVGNGYRSFILSDFTAPYTFAKIQAKVWKFQYTLMFASLFYNTNIGKDTTYSRKFLTFHHLSLNVGKHLNIGFFESIVYNRENNQFDPNYMVPVIFFRYMETYMGSSDKVTLGFDFKLNFARHFSTYGQIVLNEFKINELKSGNGWWGNKYALQLGLKYIDVGGVKNLDLQVEGNLARPYTYSSVDGKNSYSHYNQPLAHPQGANFVEVLALLRYQAQKRVFIQLKGIVTRIGYNDSTNYGSNILIPYANVVDTRPYGNYITQGVATNIGYAELNITYMIRHNLFLDLTGMVREQITDKNDPALRRSTLFGSMALRLNMWQRPNDF